MRYSVSSHRPECRNGSWKRVSGYALTFPTVTLERSEESHLASMEPPLRLHTFRLSGKVGFFTAFRMTAGECVILRFASRPPLTLPPLPGTTLERGETFCAKTVTPRPFAGSH